MRWGKIDKWYNRWRCIMLDRWCSCICYFLLSGLVIDPTVCNAVLVAVDVGRVLGSVCRFRRSRRDRNRGRAVCSWGDTRTSGMGMITDASAAGRAAATTGCGTTTARTTSSATTASSSTRLATGGDSVL